MHALWTEGFPVICQAELGDPAVYITPIELRTGGTEDRTNVSDLKLRFPLLCPFELRHNEVLSSHHGQVKPEGSCANPAFEFRSAERTILPDDEIDLPPGLGVDGIELPFLGRCFLCSRQRNVVAGR